MKESRKKCKVREEIVPIIAIIFLVGACLLDFGVLPLPPLVKSKDEFDLMTVLFSVLAGVAVTSIAILSIISGVTNQSYLGISESEYITSIKPGHFTHKRLIISNFIIIGAGALTIIFGLPSVCLCLFFISLMISIKMVNDTYIVFAGAGKLTNKIREHLIENYTIESIVATKNALIEAIDNNDQITLEDGLSVFCKIWEKELKKEADTKRGEDEKRGYSKELQTLINVSEEMMTRAVHDQAPVQINRMMQYINDAYRAANNAEVRNLPLWNRVMVQYLRGLQYIREDQIIESSAFYELHSMLYENLSPEEHNYQRMSEFIPNIYDILIIHGAERSAESKQYVKLMLAEMQEWPLLYCGRPEKDEWTDCKIHEFANLLKAAVDAKDDDFLDKQFFRRHGISYADNKIKIIYLILYIYLYYLAEREELAHKNQMDCFAKDLLQNHTGEVFELYGLLRDKETLQTYINLIYQILGRWKLHDEDGVAIMSMDCVIEDFLIFLALWVYPEKEMLFDIVRTISRGSIFQIHERFLTDNRREDLYKRFQDFQEAFIPEKEKKDIDSILTEDIPILRDVVEEQYRNELCSKGNDSRLQSEDMDWLREQIETMTGEFIKENLEPFAFRNQSDHHEMKRVHLGAINWHNCFVKEKRSNEAFLRYVYANIMRTFLNRLGEQVHLEEVSNGQKNKQQLLLDSVRNLHLSPDTYLGEKDYFWDEEDRELLKRYTSAMTRIRFPRGYNYCILLEKGKIEFSIKNVEVSFSLEPEEQILSRCRTCPDGRFAYNVTNDIWIPFSREELVEYVHNTQILIDINAEVGSHIADGVVGTGIRITN